MGGNLVYHMCGVGALLIENADAKNRAPSYLEENGCNAPSFISRQWTTLPTCTLPLIVSAASRLSLIQAKLQSHGSHGGVHQQENCQNFPANWLPGLRGVTQNTQSTQIDLRKLKICFYFNPGCGQRVRVSIATSQPYQNGPCFPPIPQHSPNQPKLPYCTRSTSA